MKKWMKQWYFEVAILEKMTLVLCNAEYLKKVGSRMLRKTSQLQLPWLCALKNRT
jgi:hypothetical protein